VIETAGGVDAGSGNLKSPDAHIALLFGRKGKPMEVSFKLLLRDYYLLLHNIPEASHLYAFLRNGAIVSDSSGCMLVQILCNDEQQAKILASLAQRICSNAVRSIEEGIKSASPRA
jgi:hypothetical protein